MTNLIAPGALLGKTETARAMEVAQARIAGGDDRDKRALFFSCLTHMLSMTDQRYSAWKQSRRLQGLQPEDCIALIRAKAKSDSPLLDINQGRVERYSFYGALIREGRELRRIKRIAEHFSPRLAAE